MAMNDQAVTGREMPNDAVAINGVATFGKGHFHALYPRQQMTGLGNFIAVSNVHFFTKQP